MVEIIEKLMNNCSTINIIFNVFCSTISKEISFCVAFWFVLRKYKAIKWYPLTDYWTKKYYFPLVARFININLFDWLLTFISYILLFCLLYSNIMFIYLLIFWNLNYKLEMNITKAIGTTLKNMPSAIIISFIYSSVFIDV